MRRGGLGGVLGEPGEVVVFVGGGFEGVGLWRLEETSSAERTRLASRMRLVSTTYVKL